MTTKKKLSNYQYFLIADTKDFPGQWVAIADEKVVAHGRNAKTVYEEARKKYPTEQISLSQVPKYPVVIY